MWSMEKKNLTLSFDIGDFIELLEKHEPNYLYSLRSVLTRQLAQLIISATDKEVTERKALSKK